MSGKKPSDEELQQRLEQAEAALAALRRGEVDLVLGDSGPLLVRLKSLIDENERLTSQWKATFDAAGDAIFVLDTEHRVLQANRAAEAAFDCPRAEMIGKRCCEIVHGTAAPIPDCPFHRMRTSLQRERLEMQVGERWFAVTTDPILDEAGRVRPCVWEARRRGVLFDLGHGAGSFAFDVARKAMAQDFLPDSLSTDLYYANVEKPVKDFPTTISKFLNLGLPLEDALARATCNPARALGEPTLGTLAPGSPADIALFTLREGAFSFVDCLGQTLEGPWQLTCELTLYGGQIIYAKGA